MPDTPPRIAWVETTTQEDATGELAKAYDAVKGADGRVENLYLAMSQTAAAIIPADAHYLAVLHNSDNPLPNWLSELVSTYVAILCGSEYARTNHGENFRHYLGDDARAKAILIALERQDWEHALPEPPATLAALAFTQKLSERPAEMTEDDIIALRAVGYEDKAISYLVQIVSSFAYWARVTNGLGMQLGDKIGLTDRAAGQN